MTTNNETTTFTTTTTYNAPVTSFESGVKNAVTQIANSYTGNDKPGLTTRLDAITAALLSSTQDTFAAEVRSTYRFIKQNMLQNKVDRNCLELVKTMATSAGVSLRGRPSKK